MTEGRKMEYNFQINKERKWKEEKELNPKEIEEGSKKTELVGQFEST